MTAREPAQARPRQRNDGLEPGSEDCFNIKLDNINAPSLNASSTAFYTAAEERQDEVAPTTPKLSSMAVTLRHTLSVWRRTNLQRLLIGPTLLSALKTHYRQRLSHPSLEIQRCQRSLAHPWACQSEPQ